MELNERIPLLREKTHKLTRSPGVYIMKNKSGKIIYIGKAKNLKNRVTSYFRENPDHTPKVAKMVSQVDDYDFIVTDSEYEALLLECSLIKLHKPKYNILLKDDKGYHYIKISSEAFPRISTALRLADDGAQYIGPFTSAFVTRKTVDEANKIFMLPTCSHSFPAECGKRRPCLNFHIKQCMGICTGKISQKKYSEVLAQALEFIRSGSGEAVESIQREMAEAAESLDFERAALLRDRLKAIELASDSQKIIGGDTDDADIIAVAENLGIYCVSVLVYRGARLVDKAALIFDNDLDEEFPLDSVLPQFYADRDDIPPLIMTDRELGDEELLSRLLSEKSGRKVHFAVPKKGQKHSLIAMSKSNAIEELSVRTGRSSKEISALEELKKLLGLDKIPEYIEAYDISNLASESMVAGMVVFENGRALKKAYKKYSIKSLLVQNDYASMREVIERRFTHYLDKAEKDEGFKRLPDLIFVDGGKGQVGAVVPTLRSMGIRTPVFGIVKDNRHRTRAIASDGGEISVSGFQSAFMLITRIQDEMHRFAISYQRKKHKASAFESVIGSVKGVGAKKLAKLISEYKTKEALKSASRDELKALLGLTDSAADELFSVIKKI